MTQALTPNTAFEFAPPAGQIGLIALNGVGLIANQALDIDFTDLNNRNRLDRISSVYLDTTRCRGQIGVTNAQTQQRVVAPAGTAGWYAFPLRDPLRFAVLSGRSGTLNISVSSALIFQAPVETTGNYQATYTIEGAINASLSNVLLASENFSRSGASIYNNSTDTLFVRCSDSAATTATFTKRLQSQEYWETPFGYSGAIQGIWSGTNGQALVTEFN
jgi:hypothetical protein